MATSMFASRLASRVGVQPPIVAGLLSVAVGLLLFARVPTNGHYVADLLLPAVLVAAGMGISFVPLTIAAMGGVRQAEAGLASGLLNTSRQMGGALGLAILASVATAHTNSLVAAGHAARVAETDGFHRAFVVGGGFAAVGAVVALTLLGTRRAAPAPDTVLVEAH
jgi:MFS family permease